MKLIEVPENLQPYLDFDIIRYECGFASEAGWKMKTGQEGEVPPWSFVADVLHLRLENIKTACKTDKDPILYYTSGHTFRYDVAKRKPYKGQRRENKPYHFDNLTVYGRDILGAKEITGIEADDALSIDHCNSNGTSILVSRDKDLKQCRGFFYGWELYLQPSIGPLYIDTVGELELSPKNDKIVGTGEAFFWSQVLTGDTADNTPGLPKCGPVAAYGLLNPITASYRAGNIDEATCLAQLEKVVQRAYKEVYGATWKEEMQEQVTLHWLVRSLNEDGSPCLREVRE